MQALEKGKQEKKAFGETEAEHSAYLGAQDTSHKRRVAFAEMDPSLWRSGKYIGKSKLSKRGDRHPRRAIYLIAVATVSKDAFFKVYFFRGKKEGSIPQKALLATAHKMIRVIFAMLSHPTYFQVKMAL